MIRILTRQSDLFIRSRRKYKKNWISLLPWLPLYHITRTNVAILIAIIKTTPPTTPPIAAPIAEGTAVHTNREYTFLSFEERIRQKISSYMNVAKCNDPLVIIG